MNNTTLTLTNCTIEETRNGSCTIYKFSDNSDVHKLVLKEGARTYSTVGLVLSWLWAVLIISLNLIVIVLICTYKKRSRLYFFLLNLAIADLAAGLLDAFPNAVERSLGIEFAVPFWMAGDAFCKIQRTVANTCSMTSNYILAVMSLDRAYAICKPMKSIQKGSILQKAIVISCWIFCFLSSSPFFKFYVASYYGRGLSFGDQQQCILYFGDTYAEIIKGHTVMLYLKFVFMFLIPLFIIFGSYTLLVVFIFRRALKQSPSEKKASKTAEKGRINMSRVFNKGVPKSKMKSIKLTLGIVLSFLICWMAFFIGYFLSIYAGVNHPLLMILTTFYYWNSIANPVLFFVYHRKKVRSAASRPTWSSTGTSHTHHKSTGETFIKAETDKSVPLIVKEKL